MELHEVRKIWAAHGGSQHGPTVETWTIPEDNMRAFVEALLSAARKPCVRLGDKVSMCGERQRYTVQGTKGNLVVATKPFNARHTYLYTIIDVHREVRGPLNSVFGLPFDVDSPKGAADLLAWMDGAAGSWGVSRRKEKPLTDTEKAQVL